MDSGSSTVLVSVGGGHDKLSSLGDAVLGHILSFLPATEAARTATLSRRWRHVFAAVHTLSFRDPEAEARFRTGGYPAGGCSYCDIGDVRPSPFVAGVGAALYGRHRGSRAATAPLRALRVAFGFRGGEEVTKAVDGWVSYAVHNAGEALEIDLRLGTEPICERAYALVAREQEVDETVEGQDYDATDDDKYDAAVDDDDNAADADDDDDDNACDVDYDDDNAADADADGENAGDTGDDNAGDADDDNAADVNADNDNAGDADDDNAADADAAAADADGDEDNGAYYEFGPMADEYMVPRSLFSSCARLRTLRLSRCWIDPPLPSAISLPSLETLHLTRVTGRRRGRAIQRLVSACPSLVDLTLEACKELTALSLHGACLRRLAVRCCHELATIIVGTPELLAFEYSGSLRSCWMLPARLLTMHAHSTPPSISFCAFDFCGREHGGELFRFTELLPGLERLHVTSARLGSSFISFSYWGVPLCPCMPMLRSLQMTGILPDEDGSIVSTVAWILERTPRLETLSLFFLPEPHPVKDNNNPFPISVDQEVLNASHELRFDPHARLAAPPRDVEIPSCLRETTKEINLVHYQGSVAQRALAKFLLCNAPVVDEVCWKVARGPLSIQTKLMEEVRGWVTNKSANMMFF